MAKKPKIALTERERLELICEAVQYCQKVRKKRMPVNCYTKALREPIYFLWELRGGRTKDQCAAKRSKATMEPVELKRGDGNLIYDHAVPYTLLEAELLALETVTAEAIRPILERCGHFALVTKEEHGLLKNTMPEDWTDPYARYEAVKEITLIDNPLYKKPAQSADR